MSIGEEMFEQLFIEAIVFQDETEERIKKKIWVTEDGKEIPIKDMDSLHIQNCIKMLERKKDNHTAALKDFAEQYIGLFKTELNKRFPPIDPAFAME